MRKYNIAVVGATGAVGEEIFRVLDETNFPVGDVLPLSSSRSAGVEVEFGKKTYEAVELTEDVFKAELKFGKALLTSDRNDINTLTNPILLSIYSNDSWQY